MKFHFTIRDLLWLTVVVALIVGAWLERRYLASENARLQERLKSEEQLVIALQTGPGTSVSGPNPNPEALIEIETSHNADTSSKASPTGDR